MMSERAYKIDVFNNQLLNILWYLLYLPKQMKSGKTSLPFITTMMNFDNAHYKTLKQVH